MNVAKQKAREYGLRKWPGVKSTYVILVIVIIFEVV
jgi:hypothetical protein